MKKALLSLIPLLVASFVVAFPFSTAAQNREKFVISAHAGAVNAVTGRATLRSHGSGDWQQLTITEDLETGDVVKTGLDGRVEMLLNPGSYLRIGENSEIELTDNSLENLELRLVRGTAIVEVTGTDDTQLLINIATPHTRMAIVRRGLYRVNVVPGDATELIVRKGRVLLEPTHTKIKGGDKVIFSDNSFSVAKLKKKDGCYTFFPFSYGWGSPYGTSYGSSLYGTIYRNPLLGWSPSGGSGGSGNGTGNGVGSGTGGGNPNNVPPPRANPISESPRVRDFPTAGPANAHRPDNP